MGGDGTFHEVVNGMLHRQDKKQLPLAFIPNGTGNDVCKCFKIKDVETALNFGKARNTIKIDVFKALLDYETEEELLK